MHQPTFASVEFEQKKRKTRRELFLERLDALVPWEELEARIEPHYPRVGRGRRPYPLAVMLRSHCVQLCYNLSDPAMEDLLYEAESVRRFCGLTLTEAIPDESTILHFRHLLERHDLGTKLFETINAHLARRGLRLREGTIVDASIIEAPSSTKNRRRARDPEMHQTKKGKEWRFGMKLHIGVDADSGLVHSMRATAANVADVTEAHRLLHGEEREAYGDAGYRGVEKRPEQARSEVEWRVALRPGLRRLLEPRSAEARVERAKAVGAGEGGAPLPRGEAALRLRQGALPRSGEEPRAAGAAAGLDEPAQSRAPTRLTRGAVRPPRPSKRDGRANAAPDLPRPPPLPSSLSNTTCCWQQSAAGSLLAQRIPRAA